MSYCRTGNPVIPDFYIFPTRNEDDEQVLAVYLTNPHQELNEKQVKCLREILNEWLVWQKLRKKER